jgi:hypothetical protein
VETSGPIIFAAIRQPLELKLDRQKGPVVIFGDRSCREAGRKLRTDLDHHFITDRYSAQGPTSCL